MSPREEPTRDANPFDPGRFWQDSDDPDWSDEIEARFLHELNGWNVVNALRPRDEYDVDVDPETFRGQMLAYYDLRREISASIAALPWYIRWPIRAYARLRGTRL